MAFHVGQKIVCVDVDHLGEVGGKALLHVGEIYQIEQIISVRHPLSDLAGRVGNCAFHLRGIMRAFGTPYGDFRFRPVAERKTDISIFTAMLTPNKERVS